MLDPEEWEEKEDSPSIQHVSYNPTQVDPSTVFMRALFRFSVAECYFTIIRSWKVGMSVCLPKTKKMHLYLLWKKLATNPMELNIWYDNVFRFLTVLYSGSGIQYSYYGFVQLSHYSLELKKSSRS